MKRYRKLLLIPVVLVIIYIAVIFCIQIFYISEDSKGVKIDLLENRNAAILVIDVQNMLTHYDNPEKALKYKVNIFLNSINTVLNRLSGLEVIYIRQEFKRGSLLSFIIPTMPEEGKPGTGINKAIYRENSMIFTKSRGDAFTNPALQEYLISKRIGTLYITGLAAEACVDKTVTGAAAKGYKLFVVREAVLSMFGGEPGPERLDKYRSHGAEVISVNELK